MHNQENTPIADELKNLSPDMFAPAGESSVEDNEKIVIPYSWCSTRLNT